MLPIFIILSQIADYITTVMGIKSGKGREGNPIAAFIIDNLGLGLGFFLVKIAIALLVIYAFRGHRLASSIAIGVGLLAAISNTALLIK
jgi:uncharacterized membrane protein